VVFPVPKRNWRNDSTKALRVGQRGGETLPRFILAAGGAKCECSLYKHGDPSSKAARHRPPTAVSADVAYTFIDSATLDPACCVAEAGRVEHWRIRVPFCLDRRRRGAVATPPRRVRFRAGLRI